LALDERIAHGLRRGLVTLALGLIALGSPLSCGRSTAGGTDSNTHWLTCDTSADCAPDRVCKSGLCAHPTGGSAGAGTGGGAGATGAAGGNGGTSGPAGHCGDCTSQEPACLDNLQTFCAGLDHCPPTVDDERSYDRWPQDDPGGASVATYTLCPGGLTSFNQVDGSGQASTSMLFSDGSLLELSSSSATCGPIVDWISETCRSCNILRPGGLERVGSSTGEGGAGGAAGPTRDETGMYYCLVDSEGKLTVPPSIPSDGERACMPLALQDQGAPCTGPTTFYWNGSFCMPYACTDQCIGEDCKRLSASAEECDTAYAGCYAKAGIHQQCTSNEGCVLAIRSCCGHCGTLGADDLIAIRAIDLDEYQAECASAACVECVTTPDPLAKAVCSYGTCTVAVGP
jgi:hypothetical protein